MADGSIIIDTKLNITSAKRDMKELTNSINETQTQMDLLVDKFIESKRHIKNLSDKDLDRMVNNFKQSNAEYQGLVAKQKELTAGVKEYQKALTGTTKASSKVTTNFSGIGKSIQRGTKQLMRFSLALVGMAGLTEIINSSLREWGESGNEEAQQLQANIKQLKTAIGASLAPAIEYVLKLFYNVLGAVNSILKAFTGINLLSKTTAKSTGQTAKNAKGALGSFDELNTLLKGDEATSTEPTGNLQTVVKDFTNLENLIMEKDWVGVGEYIAENINKGIQRININVGGMTTAGSSSADVVNGLVGNIDASAIGKKISDAVRGALGYAKTFLRDINWYELGKRVGEFIASIDWLGIIADLFEGLTYLATAIFTGMVGILEGAMNKLSEKMTEYFQPYMEEEGGNLIKALLYGMSDIVKNFKSWFEENIFKPMVDAIGELFGIENLSESDFYKIGSKMIEQLQEGMKPKWLKVLEWWENEAKPAIIGWFSKEETQKMMKGLLDGAKAILNAYIGIWEKAINYIIGKINKLHWDIPEWVPGIGGKSFGFEVDPITIPRLAKGGIAYQPTQAIIGEAGREAVLPLENNTEWMDDLAERISLNQNVNIEFTGSLSQLARVLNPVIKKEQTRAGARLIGGAL